MTLIIALWQTHAALRGFCQVAREDVRMQGRFQVA
jgi:hypothetical protein